MCHAVLEGNTLGIYSQSTKRPELCFLQVKFIEFLSVNVNASRVCDIRYKINDFIAFLLLHFSKFDIEWLCPDAFNCK